MQTIEVKVQVGSDRTLRVQLPADVPIGEYEVVLVLNQSSQTSALPDATSISEIQSLLRQSVEPGRSLANELIQERREAARDE